MLDTALLRASWQSWLASDFRRVGPWWLQLVWTFVFCALLALAFTVLGFALNARRAADWLQLDAWRRWYGLNLAMCLVIGFLIHALFELGARWLGPARLGALAGWRRGLFYGGIPLLGVAVGWPLGYWMIGTATGVELLRVDARVVVGGIAMALLLNLVLYLLFEAKARQLDAERRATEGQLRLLQAQIEPHFLFNTLANVLSLMDADAPRARRMLESFTDYLRASLGNLRQNDVPLEAELQLSRAYLQVMQLRVDDRLRFMIEVEPQAGAVRVPPLLLQPLIENAIQHGLEPKLEGGTIRVRAVVQGGRLQLSVDDDGLGIEGRARTAAVGNGLAMANIRSRLMSRYGDRAALLIEPLQPGTRAMLSLPVEAPALP